MNKYIEKMEIALSISAIALGYVVATNKQRPHQRRTVPPRQKNVPIKEEFVPNMSDQVTPGGRVIRYNKVDYANSGHLPLEYVEHPDPPQGLFHDSKASEVEAASSGAPIDYGMGISLTGEPINPATFVHDNQVPFFGGNLKQNVDDKVTTPLLDLYTGTDRNYEHKREIRPMFKPHTNITNPYGMANYNTDVQNRFIPSIKRSGEAPIQAQQVGPGLNKGYTTQPSGGFQQADTRDYVIPKTVDELRSKNNPKLTYQGRVITGHKSLTRGTIGIVQKQNPDTFYINTPDRYFTTTGAYSKPRHNSTIIMREGNRKHTGLKRRINPAGPATGTRESRRAEVQPSTRTECMSTGPRNADATGNWAVPGLSNRIAGRTVDLSDYGRGGVRNVETFRACTSEQTRIGNAGGNGYQLRNNQAPRHTKKNNVIGNPHWGGNLTHGVGAGHVRDPNDIARTTIKETTLHDTGEGNLTGPTASYVYDPDDTARTTIKETTIHNTHAGNIAPNQPEAAYIRNGQKAKTTHRQTQLTDYTGGINAGQEGGAYTIKQIDLPGTNRQTTTGEYTGGAGAGMTGKQRSRKAEENLDIRSTRNSQLRSHFAGREGPNQIVGESSVNMHTKRHSDLNSAYIRDRGLNGPTAYNSAIPTQRNVGVQNFKNIVPNLSISNRLDTSLLDALKTNPYAKSLHSSILSS